MYIYYIYIRRGGLDKVGPRTAAQNEVPEGAFETDADSSPLSAMEAYNHRPMMDPLYSLPEFDGKEVGLDGKTIVAGHREFFGARMWLTKVQP